jgi:hypothetical protein
LSWGLNGGGDRALSYNRSLDGRDTAKPQPGEHDHQQYSNKGNDQEAKACKSPPWQAAPLLLRFRSRRHRRFPRRSVLYLRLAQTRAGGPGALQTGFCLVRELDGQRWVLTMTLICRTRVGVVSLGIHVPTQVGTDPRGGSTRTLILCWVFAVCHTSSLLMLRQSQVVLACSIA